jgi:hypothetical protein
VAGVDAGEAATIANRSAIGKTCQTLKVHVLDAGHFALDTAEDEIDAWVGSLWPFRAQSWGLGVLVEIVMKVQRSIQGDLAVGQGQMEDKEV